MLGTSSANDHTESLFWDLRSTAICEECSELPEEAKGLQEAEPAPPLPISLPPGAGSGQPSCLAMVWWEHHPQLLPKRLEASSFHSPRAGKRAAQTRLSH